MPSNLQSIFDAEVDTVRSASLPAVPAEGETAPSNFSDYLTDIPVGVASGVTGFVQSVGSLVESPFEWVGLDVVDDSWWTATPFKTKTWVGDLTDGITQFGLGFALPGGAVAKVGAVARLAQGGRVARAAGLAIRGAVADFTAFQENEQRLSNVIEQFPALRNPVTGYLSAKEGDSWWEGRIKNVIEGAALGVAGDVLFAGVKALRAGRTGGDIETALKEVEAATQRASAPPQPTAAGAAPASPVTVYRGEPPGDGPKLGNGQFYSPDRSVAEMYAGSDGTISERVVEFTRPFVADNWGVAKTRLGLPKNTTMDDLVGKIFDRGYDGIIFANHNGKPEYVFPVKPTTPTFYTRHGLEDPAPLLADLNKSIDEGLKAWAPFEDALGEALRRHINYSKLDINTDTKALLKVVEDATQPYIDKATGGVQSLEAVKELAEQGYGDTAALAKALSAAPDKLKDLSVTMVQGRVLRNTLAERLVESRRRLGNDPTNESLIDEVAQGAAYLVKVDQDVATAQKEIARALGSFRIVADTKQIDVKRLARGLREVAAGKNASLSAEKLGAVIDVAQENPEAALKWLRLFDRAQEKGGSLLRMHNEFWMSMLLSGVRTQVVNLTSNSLSTLLQPAERILGGAVGGNAGAIRSGLRLYGGMLGYFTDWHRSMEMYRNVKTAFKTEIPVLDRFGSKETTGGAIPGLAGRIVRLPFRIMGGTDEFFKQLNYRAAVRDMAYREAESLNIRDAGELAKFVDNYIKDSFDDAGRAARNEDGEFIREEALQFARSATFSQDLLDGTIGNSLQSLVNEHPALRLVVPFVKTPTNIIRKVVRYTPGINLLQKEFRTRLSSPDPVVRAQAKGEFVMGSAFWTTAVVAAQGGVITGGGPSNKEERDLLLATGWRPYSFVRTKDDGTKEYVEFRRMDPYASLLGLAADFAEIGANLDEGDNAAIAQAMLAALARNLTNKTYTTGIAEIANLLTAPDRYIERWLTNRAASYVPNLTSVVQDDEYMRDVRSILDGARRKIPGLSESLPPRRNILGEPITPPSGWLPFAGEVRNSALRQLSPAAYSRRVGDKVKEELASLHFGFAPPARMSRGVPLDLLKTPSGQNLYDRYVELQGQVKIGKRDLGDALEDLVSSDRYQRTPPPDGLNDQLNPRVQMIQSVLRRYRDRAMTQLHRENPTLRELQREVIRRSRSGRTSATLDRLLN